MVGNMWTAECSYINNLIHQLQFSSKMDEMVDYSLSLKDEAVFPMPRPNFSERPYDYALKRFSFEHWVGSHPKLKPCDVFPDPAYKYGFLGLDTTTTTTTMTTPRVSTTADNNGGYAGDGDAASTTSTRGDINWEPILRQVPWIPLDGFWHWSFTEWFCGRGRLAQYKFLYGMYPDADSFLWSYYDKPIKLPFKNLYSLFDRGCPVPIRKSDYL